MVPLPGNPLHHGSASRSGPRLLEHSIFGKSTFAAELNIVSRDPNLVAAAALSAVLKTQLILLHPPGTFSRRSHLERRKVSVSPKDKRPMDLIGELHSGETPFDLGTA